MEEIWKDIKGFEGYYQVSNLGRVKSLPKLVWQGNGYGMHKLKERILKDCIHRNGYHLVGLSRNGEKKRFLVHRLVYENFVGDIPNGMQINHIDECKDNNALSNLNLMTPKQNINWATGIERGRRQCKKKVIMDNEKEFDSLTEAAAYLGCGITSISNCCNNRIHTLYGHTFRYKQKEKSNE